jgi:violaxanthin de-epoxidase
MMIRQLLLLVLAAGASSFVLPQYAKVPSPFGIEKRDLSLSRAATLKMRSANEDDDNSQEQQRCHLKTAETTIKSVFLAAALSVAAWAQPATVPTAQASSDPGAIVGCLVSKCQVPFAKCITNPMCLANVICINSCANKDDEAGCQVKCGDIFDNGIIGEFNKCAVSDMSCVPQKGDEGLYPEPKHEQMVSSFDTKFFNEKLFITAGLNPLFDTFPCQVHFFTETSPGTFYGNLNWDIVEPDGELFTRDAVQQFIQDKNEPGHLVNHDNEYLHYKDDWYIIDYEYEGNSKGLPPFAFVFYRGSNDAWDGYGGAVVYTSAAKLPKEIIPRLEAAAKKVGHDWSEFTVTDNSCNKLNDSEKLELREKFLGDRVLQTEKQLQAQATKVRGNAANNIKAQKLFYNNQGAEAEKAFQDLKDQTKEFEKKLQ